MQFTAFKASVMLMAVRHEGGIEQEVLLHK